MDKFLLGLITAIVVEFIAWLYYYKTKNPTIVDVFWPITIWAISFPGSSALSSASLVLLSLWTLRLSGFLWITRVRKSHIDPRYTQLSEESESKDFFFFKNFQLQGLLALFLSQIFLFADPSVELSSTFIFLGGAIALTGLLIETWADFQLHKFKQENSGILCESGLWKFSRHPNYVGEVIFWIGMSIFVWEANSLSFITPIYLWALMNYITIPITESHKQKKYGDKYLEHAKRVRRWH